MTDTTVVAPETIAPAVAPAPAPAAAPAPVALTDQPAPAPAPAFESTGDAGLDLALKFVQARGVDLKGASMAAAKNGDFSFLKAEMAALGEKATGWQDFLVLAEQAYSRQATSQKEAAGATEKIVHETVGGADNWTAIQAWASANADPHEKEQINAAFAAGGLQARAAALFLANAYNKAGGTKAPKEAAKADASAQGPGASSGPLSAKEYASEVASLRTAKGGRDVTATPEYRALQSRRLVGMKAGK